LTHDPGGKSCSIKFELVRLPHLMIQQAK
jgi:hypothetical protein